MRMKTLLIILSIVLLLAGAGLALLENGQYNESWKYIHTTPEDLEKVILDLQAKQVFTVHHDKFALSVHPWYEPSTVAHDIAAKHNIHLLDAPIGTVVKF